MGIAAIGSLAATGLNAVGSVVGGQDQARKIRQQAQQEAIGRMYQAGQLEIAAAVGDLKATQTDTAMRQKTMDAVAGVDAVLALTGTTDNSPSSWAVKNRFEQVSDDARAQAVWNLKFDAQSKRNAAALYKLGAIQAIDAGNAAAGDAEMNGILGGIGGMLGSLGRLNFTF
jgi:hypothetical protein